MSCTCNLATAWFQFKYIVLFFYSSSPPTVVPMRGRSHTLTRSGQNVFFFIDKYKKLFVFRELAVPTSASSGSYYVFISICLTILLFFNLVSFSTTTKLFIQRILPTSLCILTQKIIVNAYADVDGLGSSSLEWFAYARYKPKGPNQPHAYPC